MQDSQAAFTQDSGVFLEDQCTSDTHVPSHSELPASSIDHAWEGIYDVTPCVSPSPIGLDLSGTETHANSFRSMATDYVPHVEYRATASYRRPAFISSTSASLPSPNASGAGPVSSSTDSAARVVEILESIKHSANSTWSPDHAVSQTGKDNTQPMSIPPCSPYSPQLSIPMPRADNPGPYVTPLKKDISIILQRRKIPLRVDPNTEVNLINAQFAQVIGATINYGAICTPIPLPTFGRKIQPAGIASLKCEFEGEERLLDFVVIEDFVYQAVLGRGFLGEARNWSERRVGVRDTPIVPYLGGGKERVKLWVEGEDVMAIPDAEAEVNVMALDFAARRGFDIKDITAGDHGQIRFADRSVQDVKGVVSVLVSFGSGTSLLQMLDGSKSAASQGVDRRAESVNTGGAVSIIAYFYILEGLDANVVVGEDVLSTARQYVEVPTETSRVGEAPCDGVISIEIESAEETGDDVAGEIDEQRPLDGISARNQGREEIARYEKEQERIRELLREKRRTQQRSKRKLLRYKENHGDGATSGSNAHYHLCPCKLHSLDKK